MNNDNDNVFQFGIEENDFNDQMNGFNYNTLSGLGESNYENEDLFVTDNQEEFNEAPLDNYNEDFYSQLNNDDNEIPLEESVEKVPELIEEKSTELYVNDKIENENLAVTTSTLEDSEISENSFETKNIINTENLETEEETIEDKSDLSEDSDGVKEDNSAEISMSETPIEELNKLTEYKTDEVESTDINKLFDKVSVNVKDASDIFRRNTEMKQKIDIRFEELKKLQSEVENSKKNQIDEINNYKKEVLDKLTEKKNEIENRLNTLKEVQASLEKDKKDFEEYRKSEKEKIERIQKEVQAAYDDRREELSRIEDTLRKQKDALDEERSQLSLDRIQYESDKNELANNLLKFNELVNSFTTGVDKMEED